MGHVFYATTIKGCKVRSQNFVIIQDFWRYWFFIFQFVKIFCKVFWTFLWKKGSTVFNTVETFFHKKYQNNGGWLFCDTFCGMKISVVLNTVGLYGIEYHRSFFSQKCSKHCDNTFHKWENNAAKNPNFETGPSVPFDFSNWICQCLDMPSIIFIKLRIEPWKGKCTLTFIDIGPNNASFIGIVRHETMILVSSFWIQGDGVGNSIRLIEEYNSCSSSTL